MGNVLLKRQPRRQAPELPSGEVIVDPPPVIPDADGRKWGQMLMMLPMLAGSGAMALMFAGRGGGTLTYMTGGLFGVSSLGMIGAQMMSGGGKTKTEMIATRRDYMRHLALHRRTVRRTAQQQRRAMLYRHPDPSALWTTAESHRIWERRRDNDVTPYQW